MMGGCGWSRKEPAGVRSETERMAFVGTWRPSFGREAAAAVSKRARGNRIGTVRCLQGLPFGHYSGLAESGLASGDVFSPHGTKREVIEVQVELPLGIVLAEVSGGIYIAAVKPGGNADLRSTGKIKVGDRIVGTSAAFGSATWPSLSLERVLMALKTRYKGEVTLLIERAGLAHDIYEPNVEDAADLAKSTVVLLDSTKSELEEQVRNALRSFVELRNAGLSAIGTLTFLLQRSAELLKKYSKERGHAASVDSLYRKLKRAGVPLDNKIYNLLMTAYINTRAPEKAISVFQEIGSPNTECYTSLVKAYRKLNRLEDVLAVKSRMESDRVPLSVITYNTILSAYAERGDFESVENIFREIGARHLVPDAGSWNNRMNAHFKAHRGRAKLEKVRDIYKAMRLANVAPNKFTFTIVVSACVECGEIELAENCLEEMADSGVQPDTFIYNKVVEGYADHLRYESALTLLEKMSANGDARPNEYTYGQTIRACAAAGHEEIAHPLLETMRDRGFKPSAQVYVTLLRAYAKRGNVVSSFRLVQEMKEAGFDPDVRTMSALMHACVESNDGALAVSVYSRMVQLRMKPDVVSYTTLIRAYGKRGDTEMALRAFNAMKKERIAPTVTTFNALIELAMHGKQTQLALEALREMNNTPRVTLNRRTYELLCNSSCFENSPKDYVEFLMDVLKVLQESKMYGNGQLYCELLGACSLASDSISAKTVLEHRRTGVFNISGKDKALASKAEERAAVINRSVAKLRSFC
uniref:PDZ domain-containing protein n=1 Tax=Rhodosorus marinus TaxID=101924 RepID=A0A7S3EE33_9RHOD|mmetsp:Transcript_28742/g.112107  ORF Transcript_28742/g.112107 Transcript_28742/m.112107 type:complete len:756 (+) Transcript_28742:467-2734(+)